ncbi:hypothetical protein JZ751_016820 [Albula glossodonta]|uniref:DNA helicase B n=1 Tax=Albula glossodonta TaxID=121402 RepID=A0A8T2NY02_9TELE|nr:hypothetical protein JZ751_016820 [Albula glossodonta]
MSGARSHREEYTITGYILPKQNDAESEEEDTDTEEKVDEPDFLDMDEIDSLSSGGQVIKTSPPMHTEVKFMNLVTDSTCQVGGRFVLSEPWWEVTCRVRKGRQGKLVLMGYPSYSLRSCVGKDILSLFLKACGVRPELVTQFTGWLSPERAVNLTDVLEVLSEFEKADLDHTSVAQQIKSLFLYSEAGINVRTAGLYPQVMTYLPTLLPRHFTHLLQKAAQSEGKPPTGGTQVPLATKDPQPAAPEQKVDILGKLEEIIKTDVWKLGFKHIVNRETRLIRCEASLEAFEACGLLERIPQRQHRALQMYKKLKDHAYKGNTYMDLDYLCKDTYEVEAWETLHFLREQHVVVVLPGKCIALRDLHHYEMGIARSLGHLLTVEPWRIRLDVKAVLRSAFQRRASGGAGAEMGLESTLGGVDTEPQHTEADRNSGLGSTCMEQDPVPVAGVVKQEQDPTPVAGEIKQEQDPIPVAGEIKQEQDPIPVAGEIKQEQDPILVAGEIKQEQDPIPVAGEIKQEQDPTPVASEMDQDPSHDAGEMDQLDPDQVRAAEMICNNPVTVISGKGGCGKTTVVSLVFKAAMQEQQSLEAQEVLDACRDFMNDSGGSQGWDVPVGQPQTTNEKPPLSEERIEFLLTAPTGRAASLLKKRTGFKAFTLHQVIWSFMNIKRDENGLPIDWKFSSVRVLVVDEGSMLCVQLLHSILEMLTKYARLQKFILLGDVRQLPSIQPGNTLHDLFYSFKRDGWSIEMRTNHRAESELIVRNAGLIAAMGGKKFTSLDYDATVEMISSPTAQTPDKSFIHVILPSEEMEYYLQNAIMMLLSSAPGLDDDRTSQFVAYKRNECQLVNELCCQHYSQHTTRDHRKRFLFQLGDKICCTRNGYVTDRAKERELEKACRDDDSSVNEKKNEVKERLCNGEIFFITADVTEVANDRTRRRYLTLDDHDGREVTVCFRELQRECRPQHAWARTIHTFQGSEAETVVYVLGNGCGQSWRHVYTAVTRGKKRVYVVSTEAGMKTAVEMKTKTKRQTKLEALVKQEFSKNRGVEGVEPPNTPHTPHKRAPTSSPMKSSPRTPMTPTRSLKGYPSPLKGHPSARSQRISLWKAGMGSHSCAEDHGNGMDTTANSGVPSEVNPPEMVLKAEEPAGSLGCSRPATGTTSYNGTPSKQPRLDPVDSPLGSSQLERLSLDSHGHVKKQLFQ